MRTCSATADPDQYALDWIDVSASFIIMVLILGVMWWLSSVTKAAYAPPAPQPTPSQLSFDTIVARYRQLREFDFAFAYPRKTRHDVHLLFGPPTHQNWRDRELVKVERSWEVSDKRFMLDEDDRVWEKWVDPGDNERWVAVLSLRFSGKAYRCAKNGF
jgi:hypothetical protein